MTNVVCINGTNKMKRVNNVVIKKRGGDD